MKCRKQIILVLIMLCMVLIFQGCAKKEIQDNRQVAVIDEGVYIVLNSEGVIETGGIVPEKFNFDGWTDIKSISSSLRNAACITEDGKVFTTGYMDSGAGETPDWKDIVQVEFAVFCGYGLKDDGTVINTKPFDDNSLDKYLIEKTQKWSDIKYINTSQMGIVGIKKDGTVVAADPFLPELQEIVDKWKDIEQLSISLDWIAALTESGDLLIEPIFLRELYIDHINYAELGRKFAGAEKICVGHDFIAGLMPDGDVVIHAIFAYDGTYESSALGEQFEEIDKQNDVVDISSYSNMLVALKEDGTVLWAGDNSD